MNRISICVLAITIISVITALPCIGGNAPGTVVLDSLVELYGPVTFDHSMHTQIAESCVVCHHQHPVSDTAACTQCHSIDSKQYRDSVVSTFLSCSSCHDEPDTLNPDMPGLKVAYHRTCMECHRGMGNIGKSPKGCTEQCHAGIEHR
jgi:hypothetical protein